MSLNRQVWTQKSPHSQGMNSSSAQYKKFKFTHETLRKKYCYLDLIRIWTSESSKSKKRIWPRSRSERDIFGINPAASLSNCLTDCTKSRRSARETRLTRPGLDVFAQNLRLWRSKFDCETITNREQQSALAVPYRAEKRFVPQACVLGNSRAGELRS
jgi:hypothetical protein